MVTARKSYDLIVTNHKTVLENDIMLKICSFNLPLKIKCFVWLTCYKKKILGILYARKDGVVLIDVVSAKRTQSRLNIFLSVVGF